MIVPLLRSSRHPCAGRTPGGKAPPPVKRFTLIFLAALGAVLISSASMAGAKTKPSASRFPVNFRGSLTGSTIYFAPAGMEPDFDLVNRVIIKTHVRTAHHPPLTLILDAFLETFQSDTQPVLPDLINPNVMLSTTLGGFFSGEAIIVGRGNRVLYTGSILAEALVDPRCLYLSQSTRNPPAYCQREIQHMQVYLIGQGVAKGSTLNTRSWFVGNKALKVTSGSIYGRAHFTRRAERVLQRGGGTLSIRQVLKDFNVPFPQQRGLGAGHSGPQGLQCYATHCINPSKGRTFGSSGGKNSASFLSGVRWTMVLGFSLIGLAVILLAVYFWQGRREKQRSVVHFP